jgi:hypothetical protein
VEYSVRIAPYGDCWVRRFLVTVASLPARGRPPQAAARRAGLEKSIESCNEPEPSTD